MESAMPEQDLDQLSEEQIYLETIRGVHGVETSARVRVLLFFSC